MKCEILLTDCEKFLNEYNGNEFDLSFLDPPFNQDKDYNIHKDNMPIKEYWLWMKRVCKLIFEHSASGSSIYFMQREKNAQYVLETLEYSGWNFQNLIIWKKKASAVPCEKRFGKHYQIIVFATKGKTPRIFNKLRIDPPLLETEKYRRPNGMYVTDVWDDIRELTSGYFAGDEPLRFNDGKRIHTQQTPVRLLSRIILTSTKVGDFILDPFAGTGTTLIVAKQLKRLSLGVEIDPLNVTNIKNRIFTLRESDDIIKIRNDYRYTKTIDEIWPLVYNAHTISSTQNLTIIEEKSAII